MIESITFENFKSYEQATLKLAPLTVLIGANASGKSNALEGIRLLSWMAQGNRFSELQKRVNRSDNIIRGRINDIPKIGTNKFSFCVDIKGQTYDQLNIQLSLNSQRQIYLSSESIASSGTGRQLYKTYWNKKEEGTMDEISFLSLILGSKKTSYYEDTDRAIFPNIGRRHFDKTEIGELPSDLFLTGNGFTSKLKNILFLNPIPENIHDYSPLTNEGLYDDGSNLSSILYELWEKNGTHKTNILKIIYSLPEQNIKDIEFLQTPTEEVMIQLVETFGNKEQRIPATLLSDGTLRVLAIAAALLSTPEGSMIIIEEIGNGVHPSRARHLLAEINRIAKERSLRILISTHNPAILNSLPNDAINNTVFCYRNPETGASELTRIEDLYDYPELTAQGPLGDLLTEGIVEKFIKYHPTPEEKQKKALEWLESLKKQ